ncbi:LbetaH domain-containing protein [Parerythrobacter jejuensis]|uniref:Putative colanic acid biosynthesis acetyltransferase n=1 Tax=Parerythrobacter jejuensis TaxID=795812 RepID=A0A845ANB0_9SPHN|nr:putative colanic acid biosynthesis acetyltransferase [Parerythrobacter jejuensis]MXP31104.1 putative colanic acid biosynthesis acetyltransferase [Parerythrobacter jejuensis]MXP33864.1 putative colanic acid biosynthesis acetyltransferase [Parerythrobacter jejuensis]
MSEPLDASEHGTLRGGPSFSLANRLERLCFTIVWRGLAWLAPPPFGWGWRRQLLRLFRARIASGAKIYPTAKIWLPRHLEMAEWSTLGQGVECYNMAPICIGAGAIVSQRAFLCAGDHDHRDASHQLVTKPVTIGPKAWVAAEAFIGPGVAIGDGAVVGARACVTRDIPAGTIWTGNPAQQVGHRQEQE